MVSLPSQVPPYRGTGERLGVHPYGPLPFLTEQCQSSLAMATQPARKCRCASDTHGHKAGDCTNLITLPELSLCKPCFDKSLEELNDMGPERGKVRKEGRLKHRRA